MHRRTWRRTLGIAATWLVLLLPGTAFALVDAIEYYNAALDHYFVTAFPDEISKLDTGFFVGWQRTGQSFKVAAANESLAGGTPVCRFYGSPKSGLDSHFYSASPAECDAVAQKFPDAWLLEASNVFQVYLPNTVTGACPANSVPIYRAWNNRADSNHRYTTSLATLQPMVARGYIAEGYGSAAAPVAMCSPTGAPPGPVAQCTLTANDVNPVVGATIALTATCSGSPISYAWSGCASTNAGCLVSSSTPGAVTYSVVATNANGSSAPATLDVVWRTPPTRPTCTLSATAQTDPPTTGQPLQLLANCTGGPTSYNWTGCNSNSNVCVITETAGGSHTYSVVAANQGGASAPASLTVNWVNSPPVVQDFCGNFPAVLRTTAPWSNARIVTASYPNPGFQWNGAWVIGFTVPAGTPASSAAGSVSIAEFGGPPTARDVTISRSACDFRPVDPSGTNGPVAEATGFTTNTYLMVSSPLSGAAVLQPGQTYYINVRNQSPGGSISCPSTQQRCDASLDLSIPH